MDFRKMQRVGEKMKLYEINPEIEQLHELMIEVANNDELTEADRNEQLEKLNDSLNKMRQELEDKTLDIACLIKNELTEAQAIGLEIDRLKKRQGVHKNSADFWKTYLQKNISHIKYEDGRAKVGWRKSNSLHIDPLAEIPEIYHRVKIETDKMKLKKDIQNGVFEQTSQIYIEEKENIQIS